MGVGYPIVKGVIEGELVSALFWPVLGLVGLIFCVWGYCVIVVWGV